MDFETFSIIYLTVLFITVGLAIYRWRILSTADRFMCLLLFATLIAEGFSNFLARTGNNFLTYHFYTPIELFLISLYFDRSIRFRRPYFIGLIVGISGIILSIINTSYFQPYDQFNSYILLLDACVIVIFCFLSFYRLLIKEDAVPVKMAHFWLTICFLFFSSFTFVFYGLYGTLVGQDHNSRLAYIFNYALWFSNLFLYIGIAIVFIRYKKLIPSGE